MPPLSNDHVNADVGMCPHAAGVGIVAIAQIRINSQRRAAHRHRLGRSRDDGIYADTGLKTNPHPRLDKTQVIIGVRRLFGFNNALQQFALFWPRQSGSRQADGEQMRRFAEEGHAKIGFVQWTAFADHGLPDEHGLRSVRQLKRGALVAQRIELARRNHLLHLTPA